MEVFLSRLREGESRGDCLKRLLDTLQEDLSMFGEGSFVGIKMTIGDEGSRGYISPDLVRIVVDRLRRQGARPFVFDTNVIYKGRRQNAVDHLSLAYRKGFTPDNIGCPYIIADGVFGTDSVSIPVDFKNLKEIKVPSLVRILDDLIVLSHITGHLMSGFAGSIKNVAMGMASRAGKQIQHSSIKPQINADNCTLCECCMEMCPVSAISSTGESAFIKQDICIGCGECISACKFDAVNINWQEDAEVFAERMAEYACGILSRIKRRLFFNFAFDVTEECDCISGDDPRIVEDLGILASKDPLSLDVASYDMLKGDGDVFSRSGKIHSHTHLFQYAEGIGLGRRDYRIIEV
jgi:hypothetical protein